MPSWTELCEEEHENVLKINKEDFIFQNGLYTYTQFLNLANHINFVACFFLFLLPEPGSYTSVLDRRAILAAFLFGFRETRASFGGIIRRSARSTEERETVLLDQPAGQITAAGASDCKTLMDVRRVKPTSHLADRRQGRGRGNTNLCHI